AGGGPLHHAGCGARRRGHRRHPGVPEKSTGERTLLDINALIREVLVVLQMEIRRHAVAVKDFLATDLPAVLGRRIEIQQVVLNLVMNGMEAMACASDRRRELVVSSACQKFDGELIVIVA